MLRDRRLRGRRSGATGCRHRRVEWDQCSRSGDAHGFEPVSSRDVVDHGPIVSHGTRAASRQLSTARCAALDRPAASRRDSRQRALGRLLSAAREHASTQQGSSHAIEPFSLPVLSGLQAFPEEGFMSRKLTSRSSLENLKREAKRWLKALRENVPDARARLDRVLPDAPAEPTLRNVQHALAIEYGHSGWESLASAVGALSNIDRDSEPLTSILVAAQSADIVQLAALLDAHPELVDKTGELAGHTGRRTALHFGIHHYD